MARTYKRDSRGRFSGTGGGGKSGNSSKAAYKAATSNARFERRALAEGGGSKAKVTRANKKVAALESGRGGTSKAAAKAPKGAKVSKAAPKATTKAATKPATKPAAKASSSLTKPKKNSYAASAKDMAMARISEKKLLRGAGKTPGARADRNLQRALMSKGKKARNSERTAIKALAYYDNTKSGGRKKARKR